jgi:hypothetical protein
LARFKSEEHARVGKRTILEIEELGTLELESVSIGEKHDTVSLTLRANEMTAALMAASRNGQTFEHGRLVVGDISFDLRGIVVASVQVSGDMVSVELSCTGISKTQEEGEKEKPDRGWNVFDLRPT